MTSLISIAGADIFLEIDIFLPFDEAPLLEVISDSLVSAPLPSKHELQQPMM